ncbi:MAG: hypothetical protein EXR63_05985 [Dehalococcoidia bacterium]|nr:hypothetical protein [Dehalococcoidia bacterium]
MVPASATVTPIVPPAVAPRTRPPTGIAHIDAAIAAIEARDVDALLALMRYELQPCGAFGEARGPTECPSPASRGTLVHSFYLTDCEGRSTLRADAERALHIWLNGVQYVHGAYRWADVRDSYWGPGGVLVVAGAAATNGDPWARHLFFSDDPARAT